MANRGFERIERFISSKKCILVRQSSVMSGIRSIKKDYLDGINISRMCIHLECDIRRFDL
jgi:hypothetical protein